MRGPELRPPLPRPRLPRPSAAQAESRPGPGLGLGVPHLRGRHGRQARAHHTQLRRTAGPHEGQERGVQPRRARQAQHLVRAQPLHCHGGQDVHHQGVGGHGEAGAVLDGELRLDTTISDQI